MATDHQNEVELAYFTGKGNKELKEGIKALKKFNRSFTGAFESEHFGFSAKDNRDTLIGVINANTEWEWIFIKTLWVRDNNRSQGIGTRLMKAIIEEANRRGIYKYYLSTFEFQAPDFYKKLGFEIFGVLPNISGSYNSFFFKREDR